MNQTLTSIKRAFTLVTLALCCIPSLLQADVIAVDDPACAMTGTFATLEATGSCSIGDKTYSNFLFQSSNVAAGDLHYQIINNGNASTGFSFEIANFFATSSGAVDMTVGFDVMASVATIASVELTQVGATFNGGIASIGELVCLGGPIIGCPSQDTRTLTTTSSGSLSDNIHFNPIGEISVTKDISAIGNGGFASISHFNETVNQVPEPSFYGVILGGVTVIFTYAKRRRKAA